MKKLCFVVFYVFIPVHLLLATQYQAFSRQPSDSDIKASSSKIWEMSPYDKVSMDVITPHVKWATPLKGGRIKTLVVSHVGQREVVELAQRLSVDCRIMMMFRPNSTYITTVRSMMQESDEVIDSIFRERLAESYDLVIVASVAWFALPEYARQEIMTKVKDGTGFIYINPKNNDEVAGFLAERTTEGVEYVTTGVPLNHLPKVKQMKYENLVNFAKIGKGRVITITHPEHCSAAMHIMTPLLSREMRSCYHEYFFSLIAKAALWASRREPASRFLEFAATYNENIATLGAELSCGRPVKGMLEFAVRDEQNNMITNFVQECTLQAGKNKVSHAFELTRSSVYFLDIWLKEDGKVLDWGSAGIEIDSGNAITEITTDKNCYSCGEQIKGKVVFQENPAAGTLCTLRLCDNFDRLVSEQSLPATSKEVAFDIKIKDARSLLMYLRAELKIGDNQVLCADEKPLPMPDKARDDFHFIMWAGGGIPITAGYQSRYLMDMFYRHGVDSKYVDTFYSGTVKGVSQAATVMNSGNQYFIPYMFNMRSHRWSESEDPDKPVRHKCFTDPEYIKELTQYIERNVEVTKAHGLSVYSLSINGEIGRVDDYCFSPTCLADFMAFLKEKYGDLDTLNKHWRSDHQSWDTVKSMTFAQANKSGNYATWVDHRMHMERVFANVCSMLRNRIKELDPAAFVGIDEISCINSFSGHDWVQLSKIFDYTGSYMDQRRFEQREIARSLITERPGFSGLWMGTYNQSEGYNRYIPWYSLMKGGSSVWWWLGFSSVLTTTHSALDGSWCPSVYFTCAAEEVKEIKRGIGKLLIDSQLDYDKVAVFYSPLSVHAATIMDKLHATATAGYADRRKNSQYYTHLCFIYLLNELGLQYEFVTDEQIMEGKLERDGYKALFLPSARALSRAMAEKLQSFAENGGLLVANNTPGMMDENCHLRETTPLAGVFSNFAQSMKIVRCGKGHSLWLDNVVDSYYPRQDVDANRSVSARLRSLLSSVGVKARVRIKKPDGSDIGESEVAFFKNGNIDYLFFMRDFNLIKDRWKVLPGLYKYHGYTFPEDAQAPQVVTMTLPEKRYVYEVRSGNYIGETDTIKTTVLPATAKVYALLPYKVENIELNLNKTRYKCGECMNFDAALITKGSTPLSSHVFRVELTDPAGVTSEHLAENIIVRENGRYRGSREIALNEMTGTWRLRVKDVATGKYAEQDYVVKE